MTPNPPCRVCGHEHGLSEPHVFGEFSFPEDHINPWPQNVASVETPASGKSATKPKKARKSTRAKRGTASRTSAVGAAVGTLAAKENDSEALLAHKRKLKAAAMRRYRNKQALKRKL